MQTCDTTGQWGTTTTCVGTCLNGACTHGCSAGGCDAAGGSCTAAGEGCYCTSNAQCPSGHCALISGKNDVSCGSSCTSTSAATDGFGCVLGTGGIPTSCSTPTFAYTPSSLTSTQLSGISATAVVNLNCAGTVTYSGGSWSGATCSQTLPAPQTIAQSGGPSIDVLAFRSLAVASGVTVNFAGTNAVMILVFGDATIAGSLHADGATGVTSSSTAGASGAGGGASCSGSTGGTGSAGHTSGGGGAGAKTAGGVGAGGVGGTGGTAGNVFSSTALRGGCAGGASGDWACTSSGGGGGGALQISVAGTLTVTGTITANGGAGGNGNCASAGVLPGPNHTYGGGGGGGGSGGIVRLEGVTVSNSGTISVNGGSGGNPDTALVELGAGGPGATTASQSGSPGTGYVSNGCGADNENGGGGGGGYGALVVSSGKTGSYVCSTSLTPAPLCNAGHTACLCAADSDCPSGRCSNLQSQCTGTCTGTTTAGSYDGADCQILTSY